MTFEPATPCDLGPDALAIADALTAHGWVIVWSAVLGETVLWYRHGHARQVPRHASDGLVCYREDELAIVAAKRVSPEQLRALHFAKQFFRRSRIAEDPTDPIDWRSPHIGFVWDPTCASPDEPTPGAVHARAPAFSLSPSPSSPGGSPPCPI